MYGHTLSDPHPHLYVVDVEPAISDLSTQDDFYQETSSDAALLSVASRIGNDIEDLLKKSPKFCFDDPAAREIFRIISIIPSPKSEEGVDRSFDKVKKTFAKLAESGKV